MLHTVNKSPFEKSALASCLKHATAGSAILLIEDGVYGALDKTSFSDQVRAVMPTCGVYALGPDLDARGMSGRVMDGVKVVGYDGFVDLVAEHPNVQAWL